MATGLLSQRAYAKLRGVSLPAVQKALKSGRITSKDGKIDPAVADREWKKNTAPRVAVPRPTIAKPAAKSKKAAAKSGDGSDFLKSRSEVERYKARMARLNYEERSGKLLKREDVEAETFQTYRDFRDRMLNLSNRITDQIAAELGVDAKPVRKLIDREVRNVLQDFADSE